MIPFMPVPTLGRKGPNGRSVIFHTICSCYTITTIGRLRFDSPSKRDLCGLESEADRRQRQKADKEWSGPFHLPVVDC